MPARRSRPLLAAAVGVAACAAPLVPAVPASAAPVRPPVALSVPGSAVTSDADPSDSGVAGYVVTPPTATGHTVRGTFTVPAATCRRTTAAPLFSGVTVGGTTAGTTRFRYASGSLIVECTEGVPSYRVEAAVDGNRRSGFVSPGDELRVTVKVTDTRTTVNVTDLTSAGTFDVGGKTFQVGSVQASAQGGFDNSTFPSFGKVKFVGVTVNGTPLSGLTPFRFDQTQSGRVIIEAGPLTGGTFTLIQRGQPVSPTP